MGEAMEGSLGVHPPPPPNPNIQNVTYVTNKDRRGVECIYLLTKSRFARLAGTFLFNFFVTPHPLKLIPGYAREGFCIYCGTYCYKKVSFLETAYPSMTITQSTDKSLVLKLN